MGARFGIGLDLFGTLLDSSAVVESLRPLLGDRAEAFADLWRGKQLEYAFRRALMRVHSEDVEFRLPFDFAECNRQALAFATASFGADLSGADRKRLLHDAAHPPAFPDVVPSLEMLKLRGHRLAPFSNGSIAPSASALRHANLLGILAEDEIVSADAAKSFKPDAAVYQLLLDHIGLPIESTWVVSGNAWDVIGAKAAGLRAAWVRRSPTQIMDPWGIEPDVTVSDLRDLPDALDRAAS